MYQSKGKSMMFKQQICPKKQSRKRRGNRKNTMKKTTNQSWKNNKAIIKSF